MERTTLAAGACATAALTGATLASNAVGLTRLDLPRMLGTSLTGDGRLARALGWGLHAFNGVSIASAYRTAWRRAGVAPGARQGALLGLVHGLVSLGYMAAAPRVHPRPAAAGLRPFAPAAYGPAWIPAMVLGHVLYGAVLGGLLAGGRRRVDAAPAASGAIVVAGEGHVTAPARQPHEGVGHPGIVVRPSARVR
ncbi:MAG: hypothetical protein M9894_36495 [Planctomycetes bacterium]|nr:hypothetical protein [Planctomycetota bacterium]